MTAKGRDTPKWSAVQIVRGAWDVKALDGSGRAYRVQLNGGGGIYTAVSIAEGKRRTLLNPQGPTALEILRAIKYRSNT